MKLSKKLFLASASVMVLGLGAPSTANAFENVEWNWNNDVNSTVDINVDVEDQLDVSGLVQIEKIQMNVGDVNATSIVNGVSNNPPGALDGTATGTFTAPIDLTADVDSNAPNNPITAVNINGGELTASNGQGNVDENANEVNLQFDLSGNVEVDLSEVEFDGINDAVDLPSVESTATAVGNNQSISSTVALNLHDGQYNMGDIGFGDQRDLPPIRSLPVEATAPAVLDNGGREGGNTNTDILALATIGAALGIIQQGDVTATSSVTDILNASVDSSATAVGNNLSVDVQANTEGDALLVADLTQFNYADVTASSNVSGVSVNNYANLGVLDGPLVSSVATAVGNNVSITVASPVAVDVAAK